MSTTPSPDNPFWRFSLAIYGAEGVADECLALQERLQLDVNLLLFAAYAGAIEGVRLELQDVIAASYAVAVWHGEIVRALRRARRALKPFSFDEQNPMRLQSGAMRGKVKAVELEAEKIEQAMLWNWSQANIAARQRGDRHEALVANLHTLMAYYGGSIDQADPAAGMPCLRDAAMAHIGSAE